MTDAAPPVPLTVWLMRILALSGLAIALFLTAVHIDAYLNERRATVPGCAQSQWIDCATVLFSERYSKWLGVPVAAPAAAVYGLIVWLVWTHSTRRDERSTAQRWFVLRVLAVCIAGAAVWFVTVQIGMLGKICTWCMGEHTVSVALAALIWCGAPKAASGRGKLEALIIGVLPVAGLVIAQMLATPQYARQIVLGDIDAEGRYVEAAEPDQQVLAEGGALVLDRKAHLWLGPSNAANVMIEAIDYTCPHCRRLWAMLNDAKSVLGPQYATLVITIPLNDSCNEHYTHTEARHEHACALAKLAHQVWLIDAERFPLMHDWLFENQEGMTPDRARTRAEELVGAEALSDESTQQRAAELLARDVKTTPALKISKLPGFWAGKVKLVNVPEDAAQLQRLVEQGFESDR